MGYESAENNRRNNDYSLKKNRVHLALSLKLTRSAVCKWTPLPAQSLHGRTLSLFVHEIPVIQTTIKQGTAFLMVE